MRFLPTVKRNLQRLSKQSFFRMKAPNITDRLGARISFFVWNSGRLRFPILAYVETLSKVGGGCSPACLTFARPWEPHPAWSKCCWSFKVVWTLQLRKDCGLDYPYTSSDMCTQVSFLLFCLFFCLLVCLFLIQAFSMSHLLVQNSVCKAGCLWTHRDPPLTSKCQDDKPAPPHPAELCLVVCKCFAEMFLCQRAWIIMIVMFLFLVPG